MVVVFLTEEMLRRESSMPVSNRRQRRMKMFDRSRSAAGGDLNLPAGRRGSPLRLFSTAGGMLSP